jgi:hypothetical protein
LRLRLGFGYGKRNLIHAQLLLLAERNDTGPSELAGFRVSVFPTVDRAHGYSEGVGKIFLSHCKPIPQRAYEAAQLVLIFGFIHFDILLDAVQSPRNSIGKDLCKLSAMPGMGEYKAFAIPGRNLVTVFERRGTKVTFLLCCPQRPWFFATIHRCLGFQFSS